MAVGTPTNPGELAAIEVIKEPQFLSAAYNSVTVEMIKSSFRLGDLFFVEIYTLPVRDAHFSTNSKADATLITTLIKNGDGNGKCAFDLSEVLNSQFNGYEAPALAGFVQKDDSAFIPYFYKVGHIRFDIRNNQIKEYSQESTVKFVIRAALPLDQSRDMMEYCYQHDREPVGMLTNIPDGVERRKNEPTYLSLFMAKSPDAESTNPKIKVKADLKFHNGLAGGNIVSDVMVGEVDVVTGGVYVFNVSPEAFVAQPNYERLYSYSIWLTYEDDASEAAVITSSRTFLVADNLLEPKTVTFLNRLGGWDALQFTRNIQEQLKTDVSSYRNATAERVSGVTGKSTMILYSTWLPNYAHEWLKDLVLSPVVLLDGSYVKLQDTTHKYDSTEDVFALELTLSPEYEQNTIRL